MNKKRRKGFNQSSVRCPYCGSPAVLRSADGIYRDNSKMYAKIIRPVTPMSASIPVLTFPWAALRITSCVLCEEPLITILISSIRAA